MTNERRRYERLLDRERRGFTLDALESLELARYRTTLPVALSERALIDQLKQWFEGDASDAERQTLGRLERAALIRARHNSRASLRLLVSDEALVAPTEPASAWQAAWRKFRPRRGVALLAVTCVFASAGAWAFGSGRLFAPFNEAANDEHTANMGPPRAPAPSEAVHVPSEQPLDEPRAAAPEKPEPAPASETRAASKGPIAEKVSRSQTSPGDLLARARDALHQNDSKRALAYYRELVRRFPKSSEAASVRITVAQLELQSGSAKQALASFESYLVRGGPLSPEALAGKVQALMALGQRDQAQRAMREYVTRFPDGVHSKGYRRALAQ